MSASILTFPSLYRILKRKSTILLPSGRNVEHKRASQGIFHELPTSLQGTRVFLNAVDSFSLHWSVFLIHRPPPSTSHPDADRILLPGLCLMRPCVTQTASQSWGRQTQVGWTGCLPDVPGLIDVQVSTVH